MVNGLMNKTSFSTKLIMAYHINADTLRKERPENRVLPNDPQRDEG